MALNGRSYKTIKASGDASVNYRILMIEDDEDDVLIMKDMLRETGDFSFRLDITGNLKNALDICNRGDFDIILADLNLPDSRGIATLERILKTNDQLPIVVLTGLDDKVIGIRAVQEGAQDYLVKGQITGSLLSRVIIYSIQRKKTEGLIKASLKEKEMLLKEIHHRVKNNLQVISSLLSLQSRYLVDQHDLKMFQESQNRIRSIAMIHEKLYKSEDFSHIDFAGYIEGLIASLYNSYMVDRKKITVEVDVKDIELGIDKAVPCALIVNELLSNAIKYAFPESFKQSPRIEVHFSRKPNGESEIRISDNGIGIPPHFDIHKTESLGLYLVTILVEDQLGGTLSVQSGPGTSYTICLPP